MAKMLNCPQPKNIHRLIFIKIVKNIYSFGRKAHMMVNERECLEWIAEMPLKAGLLSEWGHRRIA
jgi:hypothetical protein